MYTKPNGEKRTAQIHVAVRNKDREYILATKERYCSEKHRDVSLGDFIVAMCIRYNRGDLGAGSGLASDNIGCLDEVIGMLSELRERNRMEKDDELMEEGYDGEDQTGA